MGPEVKISAINSDEEALAVAAEKPDIVEIIVETQSGVDPRSKSKDEAKKILVQLAGKVKTSILTDKTGADELLALIDGLQFDYLFPIAAVDNAVLEKIKNAYPQIKIVPTIHVVDETALDEVERLNQNPYIDMIHLDSRVGTKAGATGQTHDWSISAQIVKMSKKPVILAGGLKPENVQEAVRVVQPFAVDTYSGVLDQNRQLDLNRVRQFIQNAKS